MGADTAGGTAGEGACPIWPLQRELFVCSGRGDIIDTTSANRPPAAASTLERTLGIRDLIFIVIGAVIGSGIFIVPATVLRQLGGDPWVALAVWAAAGVLSLLGALTYGELGAANPEAGGLYVYLRDGFGPLPAFLFGWTLFLVIGSGAVATLAAAFAGYLGQLIPLTTVTAKISSVLMVVAVTVVNVIGTRRSASVQNWTTAFKTGALLLLGLVLIIGGDPGRMAEQGPAAPPGAASLFAAAGVAMIGVLWAYEGWQFATYSAGEMVNAQRNFPLGMGVGTAALVLLYCLANIGYISALGPTQAAASDSIAATAVGATFGPAAGKLIAAAILVSIFSAANAVVLTTPRVFYAMARDGVFFSQLAHVHPTFGTPAVSIVTMSVWAAILAATGTFEQLLTYVVFTGWIFYALGAAAIFPLRRKFPDAARAFRVPGYPVTPLLFILPSAAIVLNAVFTQTTRAVIGLCFVFAGVPAYLLWKRRVAERF